MLLEACSPASTDALQTLDTDFSKGRLSLKQQVELKDLSKFHGHLCDGLVVGYQGLGEALKRLYPDSVIDRSNTRVVSRSSPCLTDAAIYLTGGRYQYNTFYVSDEIEPLFIVQRIDNQKAVGVALKKDLKPSAIDSLGKLAVVGKLNSCELAELKQLEDDFSAFLLKRIPADNFRIWEMPNFQWAPKLKNDFIKTDILNKDKAACTQ